MYPVCDTFQEVAVPCVMGTAEFKTRTLHPHFPDNSAYKLINACGSQNLIVEPEKSIETAWLFYCCTWKVDNIIYLLSVILK